MSITVRDIRDAIDGLQDDSVVEIDLTHDCLVAFRNTIKITINDVARLDDDEKVMLLVDVELIGGDDNHPCTICGEDYSKCKCDLTDTTLT